MNLPRTVEVEHEGRWWPGIQRAWRYGRDDRGWLAEVEYVAWDDGGPDQHLSAVPIERLRLTG